MGAAWDAAPADQYVVRTKVELVRGDTGAVLAKASPEAAAEFFDLALVPYTVRAAHVNRWGRQGPWATAGPQAPRPSAADQISAQTRVVAGELSELLNDPGLAPLTDPEKLAEAVVRGAALAATQAPNLLRWDEAEFENYPLGALAGSQTGAGVSVAVVDAPAPKRWLAVSRAAGATGTTARPFFAFRDRLEGQATGTFFYSFDARNTGGSPVRVQALVEQSSDASGTAAGAVGGIVTVAPGETKQVFVKFTTTAALTSQRFAVNITDAGTSVLVNRNMVQRADPAKLEPGPYRVPGLTTGILHGRLVAARTVAAEAIIAGSITAASGLIADAAIGNAEIDRATVNKLQVLSADVVSLTADKLRAGTLTATIIALGSGGELRTSTGGTLLNSGGISMKRGPSYDATSLARDQVISDIETGTSTISFYGNTNVAADGAYRGIVLRADGGLNQLQGAVAIHATAAGGDPHGTANAALEVIGIQGGIGQINMWGAVQVKKTLLVERFEMTALASGTAAAGTSVDVTWVPALTRAPSIIYATLGGQLSSTNDGLTFISNITVNGFRVTNNRTTAVPYNVRVQE